MYKHLLFLLTATSIIAADGEFRKGIDLTGKTGFIGTQLNQLIDNATTGTNRGLIYRFTSAPTNSQKINYIWLDTSAGGTNLPVLKIWNTNTAAWESSAVAAGSVLTAAIADGAVTEPKLGGGAVTTTKIGASAVTSSKIAAGSILYDHYGLSSIYTDAITNLAVTGAKIAYGTILTTNLADSVITTAKLVDGSITYGKLATNAINTLSLTNFAVTSDKLATNAVQTWSITNYAVTTDKIATNAIQSQNITNGVIDRYKLDTNIVKTLNQCLFTYNPSTATLGFNLGISNATAISTGHHSFIFSNKFTSASSYVVQGTMTIESGGGQPVVFSLTNVTSTGFGIILIDRTNAKNDPNAQVHVTVSGY